MRTLPAPPLDDRLVEMRRNIGDVSADGMTLNEYALMNWKCELRPFIDMQIVEECIGRGNPHRLEMHHIAGRGKHAETVGNWISVCQPVHGWITDHSKPGFVLCAWVKTQKGEADWETWAACKSLYRLTWLETDDCIAACESWQCVSRMRKELLERVA